MPNFITVYHGGNEPETKKAGAAQMAKRCPFLDFGGTLEVAKMLEMPQRVLLLLKLYIRHGFDNFPNFIRIGAIFAFIDTGLQEASRDIVH